MPGTPRVYSSTVIAEAQAVRAGGREDARAALLAARERTLHWARRCEAAFGAAAPGIPYAPQLNPPWWELGHVAWFQEWWIARNRQRDLGVACDPEHARAPSLLAGADAWYDSSRVAHRSRWTLPLPGAREARDYLDRTLEQTLALLDELPAQASHEQLYFFRLVALHEAMHAEAADYMAQALGVDPGLAAGLPGASVDLAMPAGRLRMGSSGPGFAFDNELGAHEVEVAGFEIDSRPVTWGRFLPFVEARGYEGEEFWSPAGLDWRRQHGVPHPACLRHQAGAWQQRHGDTWRPVALEHAAIHLSAHEADAWCRWAGRRLPTEAEWEYAARTEPSFAWGHAWEWTASDFGPYPGFAAHPYRDYSQPWFGSRRVLRGAGPATSPALAHASYRNFFEPHRNDIFAGLRSCRTASGFLGKAV